MKKETITAVSMLLQADPESTPDQVRRITEICEGDVQKIQKRNLIDSVQAREILGISKVTLGKWVKNGKLEPIRRSRRIIKYDRDQVERLAYNGQA